MINKKALNGEGLKQILKEVKKWSGTHIFSFSSGEASKVWTITHNLNRYPSVTVVDSGGKVVIGSVVYGDEAGQNKNNVITIYFNVPITGTAYLN